MNIETSFLNYAAQKLVESCGRIETCVAKLTPEQIWMRGSENQNAVGNLMLHLAGNVRQWILTGVDRRPDVRERDAEFAARAGVDSEELRRRLRDSVEEAVAVIRSLPLDRLQERTVVQGYDVNALEAIFHVVEHFSYHAGQIIFVTKMLTGDDLGFYAHLSKRAVR